MRILKLRFQNLNSLQGEWEIDFRHAAYADEGIFAITGSTGAGKSTILDAICLALYGATPRLGEITQSKNDLMSRHTGECLSEVIFSTRHGSYRCTWLQKRARKHPTGNLQSPTHEIAPYVDDAANLPPIETQTRKTKKLVADVTGMDFDRFTRAMLLAQGSFAAFLQANSDERSSLLEEITGTEIYGDISKKVHECKSQSETALKTLTDRLSGMTVLSDEDVQTLTLQKNTLIDTVAQTTADIAKTEAAKVWRQNLTVCTQQVNQLEQESRKLAEQARQFAPQQHQLQRALSALELAGDVEKLNYQRDLLAKQLTDLTTYQQQLPAAEKNCHIAQANQTQRQTHAQQTEANWQQAQPLLNQVRELDTTLQQKHHYLQDITQQRSELDKRLTSNTHTIVSQQQALARHQNQRNQLIQAQQQITHAETLPQTLAALSQLQENSQELTHQAQSLSRERQHLQSAQQQGEQLVGDLRIQRTDLQHQIQHQRQTVDAQHNQLQQLTQGQSAALLRQQVESHWQTTYQLATMQSDVQTLQTNLQHHQQAAQQLTDVQQQLGVITEQISQTEQQQQSAQQTVDLLNRNLVLLAKIQDLTDERDKLRQGEPCPLCGATQHPFATHQPYTPDQTEQELLIARQHLSDVDDQLQQLRLEHHTLTGSQQQLTQQLQQLHAHNQALINQLQLASQPLNAPPVLQALQALPILAAYNSEFFGYQQALQTLADTVDLAQAQNQQALATLQDSLTQLETLQDQQQQTQQQLSQLTEQYNAVLHQQTVAENLQQHRSDRISDIDAQQLVITEKQTHLLDRINQLLMPFATAERTFNVLAEQDFNTQLTAHIDTLEQLFQHWQKLSSQLTSVDETIATLQQALTRLNTDQQHFVQHQSQLNQRQQSLAQDIANLKAQRQTLFGEQHVDTVSQALIAAKNQALQAYQDSQTALHESLNDKEILLKQIATLTTSTNQLQAHQSKLQATIQQRFGQLGFIDEADYQAAVLVDTERERLQQLANQLHNHQQRNHNLLTEAKRAQQHLLDHPRSDLTAAQLTEQLQQLQQQLSEQQQQLGAVEQQLTANANLQQTQQQLLDDINQQRQQTEEWKMLHSLIGSNDGKKFRNFAQGLTFNIMIAHANEQLKKMSERYLLLADPKQPLTLNVMDNYQGGQIRTSKNLSGGESFIISLALALGLSTMASHRMQVDSLFLDEGFGTLDEEALDVALDTLTTLQQSGKLIGVISHIQALKDRIGSQIQVIPQTGGISKIEGIGVTQLH